MSKRSLGNGTQGSAMKMQKHWSLGLLESMKDPASIVKETQNVVVILDKYPKAKIHYLVLPRDEINSIYDLNNSHISLLEEFGRLYEELKDEHKEHTLRAGFHAVPSMHRLHMHVISTDMTSPCLKTKIHWNTFTTAFFIPYADVLEQLKQKGNMTKISNEEHERLITTPLVCNQCDFVPKNLPKLKEHLLSHIPKQTEKQ